VFNQTVDFNVFYQAGILILESPNNLYNNAEYYLPFRYLPFAAYLFSVLSLLGLPIGLVFVIFTLASFVSNILTAAILYKLIIEIYKLPKEYNDLLHLFIGGFFLYVPHADNYVNGQINSFLGLVLIGALYCFEKAGGVQTDEQLVADCVKLDLWKYNLIGGILLGLATVIKPSAFIILPFVFIIRGFKQDGKIKYKFNFKQTMLRLLGTIIFLIPSIYIFVKYPLVFDSFIDTNFSGSSQLIDAHSFSLTRIIINLLVCLRLDTHSLLIFLVLAVVFFGIAYFNFVFRPEGFEFQFQYRYISIALTSLLIVYFDSWGHHLVSWVAVTIPLVLLQKVFAESTESEKKPQEMRDYTLLNYAISGIGLMVWTLFYYLTQGLFFENSPGFNIFYCMLIVAFYIISVRILIRNREPLIGLKLYHKSD